MSKMSWGELILSKAMVASGGMASLTYRNISCAPVQDEKTHRLCKLILSRCWPLCTIRVVGFLARQLMSIWKKFAKAKKSGEGKNLRANLLEYYELCEGL